MTRPGRSAAPFTLAAASALAAALPLLRPSPARACASCQTGDPTLTTMGAEQPYAGRVRASLAVSWRGEQSGPAGDTESFREGRLVLGVSWAPLRWLQLAANAPLVARSVDDAGLATDRLWGVGDVELRARVVVWRDRGFAPRHLFGVSTGVVVPTAGVQRDDAGMALDLDHQVGGLAVTPQLGVWFMELRQPWSLFASATAQRPIGVIGDERAGAAVVWSVAGQWQPLPRLALRAGLDGRVEQAARMYDRVMDMLMPMENTGGWAVFVTPGVVWSPRMDLVVEASAQLPIIDGLYGDHSETPVVRVATTLDF